MNPFLFGGCKDGSVGAFSNEFKTTIKYCLNLQCNECTEGYKEV